METPAGKENGYTKKPSSSKSMSVRASKKFPKRPVGADGAENVKNSNIKENTLATRPSNWAE